MSATKQIGLDLSRPINVIMTTKIHLRLSKTRWTTRPDPESNYSSLHWIIFGVRDAYESQFDFSVASPERLCT